MSACVLPVYWKIERTMWALNHRPGRAVAIAYYALVFEIDADATQGVFALAARALGIASLKFGSTEDARH